MVPSWGTSIFNNLTSLGAIGPVGAVAHEETNRMTPLIRIIMNKAVIRLMISTPSFQTFPNIHRLNWDQGLNCD